MARTTNRSYEWSKKLMIDTILLRSYYDRRHSAMGINLYGGTVQIVEYSKGRKQFTPSKYCAS